MLSLLRLGLLRHRAPVFEKSKEVTSAMGLVLLELPGPELRVKQLVDFFERSPLSRVR